MYKTILVTLDATPTDRAIIEHLKSLAHLTQSSLVLFHVIASAPAKYHGENVAGSEVDRAREYLAGVQAEFAAVGIPATTDLAYGEPVQEIVRWVKEKHCDLVAMSTHGHKFMADLVLGATAIKVQHSISVPVLLLRAK